MGVFYRSLGYIYSKYATIETDEQRSRYKDDFNTEYPLYRDLHAVIEKVSKKFAHLEERLRSEKRGSEEYQVGYHNLVSFLIDNPNIFRQQLVIV